MKYCSRTMKYTKYATFNCEGLNNNNKKSSLADDFLHHQITVMMLQETRITGQGVHKITSSNCTKLFLYGSGHQSTWYRGTGFLVTTIAEITFTQITEKTSIWTTTLKKRKFCFISVCTQTNKSTVKDPEKTQTFYEQLSDIINNINRNVLIITGGDFNVKTKMRNRDQLLKKIVGKYAKSDMNEKSEKLMELYNLHNLWITNTFFKHRPTYQPINYMNITGSIQKCKEKTKLQDKLLRQNCFEKTRIAIRSIIFL